MIIRMMSQKEWEDTQGNKFFGKEIIEEKGFIHLCTEDTLHNVLWGKDRQGDSDVLIYIDEKEIGDALKWEVAKDGLYYPHCYKEIDLNSVKKVVKVADFLKLI